MKVPCESIPFYQSWQYKLRCYLTEEQYIETLDMFFKWVFEGIQLEDQEVDGAVYFAFMWLQSEVEAL